MLNVYISLNKYFVSDLWSCSFILTFSSPKLLIKEPLDFMDTVSNNNVILPWRSANKTKTIKRWNKALYLLQKPLSCLHSIITNSWTSISLSISQLIQLVPYGKNYIKFKCRYLNPSITNLCMIHILLNNSSTRLCSYLHLCVCHIHLVEFFHIMIFPQSENKTVYEERKWMTFNKRLFSGERHDLWMSNNSLTRTLAKGDSFIAAVYQDLVTHKTSQPLFSKTMKMSKFCGNFFKLVTTLQSICR